MFGVMFRRMSLWWRFKQLDRTYQPLLEKALGFGNRDTLLKLEEQYWYQTACLLEERREIRQAKILSRNQQKARATHSNGNPHHKGMSNSPHFGSERELVYPQSTTHWGTVILIILVGMVLIVLTTWLVIGIPPIVITF